MARHGGVFLRLRRFELQRNSLSRYRSKLNSSGVQNDDKLNRYTIKNGEIRKDEKMKAMQ